MIFRAKDQFYNKQVDEFVIYPDGTISDYDFMAMDYCGDNIDKNSVEVSFNGEDWYSIEDMAKILKDKVFIETYFHVKSKE